MARKGPDYYDCNERQSTCTRAKAKPRTGCPDCEFTVQYKMFLKELERDLRKVRGTTRIGARRWPSKMLIETVAEIASIALGTTGKRGDWTVVNSTLVSIYRDEANKEKSKAVAASTGTVSDNDNDPDAADEKPKIAIRGNPYGK